MLSYWKTSLTTTEGNPDGQQVKAILIEGEVCVDFAEQAGDFCRSIRNLDVEAAHVEIALDIEKATALFKIRIPPKQKLIAEVEELAPAGETEA